MEPRPTCVDDISERKDAAAEMPRAVSMRAQRWTTLFMKREAAPVKQCQLLTTEPLRLLLLIIWNELPNDVISADSLLTFQLILVQQS